MINISDIEFLVDPRSEEMLKRYGGAILDYSDRKFYGAGFTIRLRDVADC
ncbi:MAG: hypothetical protein WC212_07025 [Candidatus Delongbacteria bacterium]|nr:hypothetical protein [Candidatus Delongbacteria bacterium]